MRVCCDAQERFLRDHLTWWTPAFFTLLSREDSSGFYEAAAGFLSAFITAERALHRIAAVTGQPAPSKLEQPDECERCQLT